MKQQYDSYKPSGIDWIGDIPSHWETCTFRYQINVLTDFTANGSFADLAANVNYLDYPSYSRLIRLTDLRQNLNNNDGVWVDESAHNYLSKSELFGGELLMANVGAYAGYVCKMPALKVKATLGPNMFLIKLTSNLSPDYYRFLLLHGFDALQIIALSSAQPKLNKENIRSYPIIVPPLAEQEAIAAWLDEKCGEIDAAIAKVDREIELIDELKQSEISRIVTRGLNPDAPLRPSGIDWIGDIPTHWTKSRIKNHISRSAAGVWGDDEKGNKNDIICFRIADFNYGERCLSFDKITIRNIDPKQLEGRYLSKGDLLIEKSGGGETTPVGRVVYCNFDGKATYTNFIHSITLSDNVDSRFFLYYFNMLYSNKINLLYFNQTTGLQNLQIGEYLGQSIYLPPLPEQQAISNYLDKKCAEIDGLKAKLTKKRETLTELRQSIISEVVTGKRKVI